jgi:hypothetical protein
VSGAPFSILDHGKMGILPIEQGKNLKSILRHGPKNQPKNKKRQQKGVF